MGGMQAHAVHLARHWHAAGHSILVVTYRASAADGDAIAFPFRVERILSRVSYEANLDKLAALVKSWRPAVIYSSTVYYGQLSARCGVPVVCRSAGNDVLRPWIAWPYRMLRDTLDRPWLERHFYHRLRRWQWPERLESLLFVSRREKMLESLAGIEHFFANSAFTCGLLEQAGVAGRRIQLLPGGVDPGHFRPATRPEKRQIRQALGLPEDAWVLLTACRLVPKKGLDVLFAALPALMAAIPELQLVIAGAGPGEAAARAAAQQTGLSDRVHWLGRVEHEDMPQCFAAANAFILPSRDHVHPTTGLRDVETMGRVLCEANAAGVPAVASESGGIPSVIDHEENGLLFAERSAEALAAAVVRLHGDVALRDRLVAAGLLRARHRFAWECLFAAHDRTLATLSEATVANTALPPETSIRPLILPLAPTPASPSPDPASALPAPPH